MFKKSGDVFSLISLNIYKIFVALILVSATMFILNIPFFQDHNEPQSYPLVGQALPNLRCGLYIRKYLFSSIEKVMRLQKNNQFKGHECINLKIGFLKQKIIS